MSNSGSARYIQKALGWKYTRALNFINKNWEAARDYAAEEGVPMKEAYAHLAKAEEEVSAEIQQGKSNGKK